MRFRGQHLAVFFGALIIAVSATRSVAGQGCEAMSEVWKQVRPRLTATATQRDLEQAEQQLQSIISNCPDDGDAWYYLSLVRRQLKRQTSVIERARSKAEEFGSKDLKAGIDPFSSANPPPPTPGSTTSGRTTSAPDRTPPVIKITSPEAIRGQGVGGKAVSGSSYQLSGEATDESGVSEVLVRNTPATLASDGKFTAEVKLSVGENEIEIKATDVYGNSASEKVTIKRKPDETVATGGASGGDGTAAALAGGRYYALLIAVQDYQDKAITQLRFPVQDAERVRGTLTKHYTFEQSDVSFLRNPDRKGIYRALDDLAKKLSDKDSLFIFYAGHGHYEEKVDEGFWLPRDAAHDVRADWISNEDLKGNLRAIKARHILLVMDSCFSGSLIIERRPFAGASPAIATLAGRKSRKALTSGAKETVPDKSIFIDHLIRALERNQEPYMTALHLYQIIREPVINESPKQQMPIHSKIHKVGDDDGDFIFVRRK